LTEAVINEFDIDATQARRDVLDFLTSLQNEGMLADSAALPGETSR
jgi:hypothetical protein